MPIAGEETPAFATARMASPAAAAPLGHKETFSQLAQDFRHGQRPLPKLQPR
jgi:hypothetical protein